MLGTIILRHAQMNHQFEVSTKTIGTRPIRLVDGEDIRDLEKASLHRLNHVAALRCEDDKDSVRQTHHRQLRLPDPDSLKNHAVEARRIEQVDNLARRTREAAEMSAT